MNPTLKQFLIFDSWQRKGIFGLFCLIIILQIVYVFIDFSASEKAVTANQQWTALQPKIDSLETIKTSSANRFRFFNPNFITDFKGYKLGMTTAQINRLLDFRKNNNFVNSAAEFQSVTKVSDSLLAKIAPHFKFPNWVTSKKTSFRKDYSSQKSTKNEKIVIKDINNATKEDFMKIFGIGEVLSERILNEKDKFGNFVSMLQVNDIYGLSPEVIQKMNENFAIIAPPKIKKIDINNVTLYELSQFPYFKNGLARKIVIYRSMNGDFKLPENLTNVKDFPVDKIEIIALYLQL